MAGITYTYIGAPGTAYSGDNPTIWSPSGHPDTGDSVIFNAGTLLLDDANLTSNTLYFAGGTLEFIGDAYTSIAVNNSGSDSSGPTLDQSSVITTNAAAAESVSSGPQNATIDAYGNVINEGTIAAAGSAGSTLTLAIAGTIINGTYVPGTFINYGQLQVAAGNTLDITIGATADLLNAGEITVSGGYLDIDVVPGALDGGYGPIADVILITGGGTVETNATYGTTVAGTIPIYAFGDATAGNTVKIDNIASFGGRFLNFGVNDTIDLGTALTVTSLVYNASTGLLSLLDNTTTIDTLLFSGGNYAGGTLAGSIAPGSTATAGTFGLTLGADGDTELVSTAQSDVFDNASGTWQAATSWSNGTPGPLDTVIIGEGSNTPFTLTTGTSPVAVGEVILAGGSGALLQITSATTIDDYGIQSFGGVLEVTSGNTLTVPVINTAAGTILVDSGAVLNAIGHVSNGSGSLVYLGNVNGTLGVSTAGTVAVALGGGVLLDNGGTIYAGGTFNPTTSSYAGGGSVLIGYAGNGVPARVTIEATSPQKAVVTDSDAIIGSGPVSFGALTLNGNVTWSDVGDTNDPTAFGHMYVGFDTTGTAYPSGTAPAPAGTAQLLIENGASLTEVSGAQIASSADSAGSATVETGGVWTIGTAGIGIGYAGSGTLDILNGGTVSVGAGGLSTGHSLTGTGTLLVDGTGALLTAAGGFSDGLAGQGFAQILNGGRVTLTGTSGISIGVSVGSSGTLIVGTTAANTIAVVNLGTTAGGISVGGSGAGTFEVLGDGQVTLNGTKGIGIGTAAAGGLMLVSGAGAIVTLGTSTTGLGIGQGSGGTGTLVIQNGGSVSFNSKGNSISVGNSAGSNGTLIVGNSIAGASAVLTLGTLSSGLTVGNQGAGTVEVLAGGTINVNGTGGIGIGDAAAGGLLLVSGTGALLNDGSLSTGIGAGIAGPGLLEIQNGGTVTVAGNGVSAGKSIGATGTISVTDGALIITNGSDGLYIGQNGAGTLNVNAGGTVAVTARVYAGEDSGSGTIAVNGGTLTAGGLTIGNSGSGTLTVTGGGQVTNQGTASLALGNGPGSSGTIVVANGTLTDTSSGFFGVGGTNASGFLTIESGGTLDVTSTFLDVNATGTGTASVEISGGTFLDTTTQFNALIIGDTGSGSLDLSSNGIVNLGSSNLSVGNQTGGAGTLTIEGGASLLASGLNIDGSPGSDATGIVTVGTAGLLMLNGTTSEVGVGNSGSGGSGTLTVNGGTVAITGDYLSVGGTNTAGTLIVEGGGTLSTGANTDISAPGTGTAVAAINGGTWIAGGQIIVGDTGAGSLDIQHGLLNAGTNGVNVGQQAGAAGTLTIENGGTLIAGYLDIADPYPTTSTAAATGTVVVGAGGLVILNDGTNQSTQIGTSGYGSASGSGTLIVNGGTLSETDAFFVVGGTNVSGVLLVENHGSLTTTGAGSFATAEISASGTGSAVVTVNDAQWTANSAISLSGNTGVLNIVDGGLLTAGGDSISLDASAGGSDTIAVGSGTLIGGDLSIDTNTFSGPTGTGTLSVGTGGTVAVTGIQVGGGGTVLVDGGTVTATGSLQIIGTATVYPTFGFGGSQGGTADLTVNGGLFQTAGGPLFIGDGGSAAMLVENAGTISTTVSGFGPGVDINGSTNAAASATITGTGAVWNIYSAQQFVVGDNAQGTLTVSNGGVVNTGTAVIDVGNTSGGNGTVSVGGSGATLSGNALLIAAGMSSTGTLSISSGGTVTAGQGGAGDSSGSTGGITVSGTGAVLDITGSLDVGNGGTGALSIANNATAIIGGDLDIGQVAGGVGSVDVTGATLTVDGNLNLGVGGRADLTVGPGASVTILGTIGGGSGSTIEQAAAIDPAAIANTADTFTQSFAAPQDYAGDISNVAFTVDQGVSVTVESPAILGATSFTLGNSAADTRSAFLTLNSGYVSSASSIVFAGTDDTLVLGTNRAGDGTPSIDSFNATIFGFQTGDQIIVDTTQTATFSLNGDIVSVIENGATVGTLAFNTPSPGLLAGLTDQVACFAAGTRIRAEHGDVAVEDLQQGHRVWSVLSANWVPVTWIGRRYIDCRRHPRPSQIWPIRIAAGAFGSATPVRDLYLSPDHAVYVDDVLIPVRYLLNHTTIAQIERADVTYYHVELDRHDVLLAEGLTVESYFDIGDRANFSDDRVVVTLHPDFTGDLWEMSACAPLVLTGPQLDAARARLSAVAA